MRKKVYDRELLRIACNGERTYKEVAALLGWKHRTVKRIALEEGLPRRAMGARKADRTGKNNPAYVAGRRISHTGYAKISVGPGYPNAYYRKGRTYGSVWEHRLVMEQHIGRFLTREEVVDHIDGLTLHNDISNLRLFPNNAEHLKATITKQIPKHSANGVRNMKARHQEGVTTRVDIHATRSARGDVRLRQILLAALQFGIDSPYLCGAHYHLKKKRIDYASRTSLELAYQELLNRYAADLV